MPVEVESKPVNSIASCHILQQTPYWGYVKSIQGWNVKAFDLEINLSSNNVSEGKKGHHDDLLVITREIGDGAEIAYVPYGPKLEPDAEFRGQVLEELSENLRPMLSPNCIMIRYDLPWESPWISESDYFDEEGKWLGPPEARIREFRMNYGTAQWNLRKAPTDNLPSSTLFIDLNNSIECLLQRMKPKTRYNINLAQRKGVQVYEAGVESLLLWYDLYTQTAKRNRFLLHDLEYFKSLIEARKVCPNKDAKVIMLIAEVNGKALAGMFLVLSGKRATYLYGASSDDCRNYMGSYALQWKAIQVAKAAGCTQYDMFGVSQIPDKSHPMYGLYRFKSGFGGRIYHRQGCWDYPLSVDFYARYRAAELTAEGYHLN